MLLDPRSGGQIRAHLRADPVVVRGRTRCGIVLALGDRPVDHLPAFQNRDRQAHHEHEQRNPEGRTLPSQTYCPLHGSITLSAQLTECQMRRLCYDTVPKTVQKRWLSRRARLVLSVVLSIEPGRSRHRRSAKAANRAIHLGFAVILP